MAGDIDQQGMKKDPTDRHPLTHYLLPPQVDIKLSEDNAASTPKKNRLRLSSGQSSSRNRLTKKEDSVRGRIASFSEPTERFIWANGLGTLRFLSIFAIDLGHLSWFTGLDIAEPTQCTHLGKWTWDTSLSLDPRHRRLIFELIYRTWYRRTNAVHSPGQMDLGHFTFSRSTP